MLRPLKFSVAFLKLFDSGGSVYRGSFVITATLYQVHDGFEQGSCQMIESRFQDQIESVCVSKYVSTPLSPIPYPLS